MFVSCGVRCIVPTYLYNEEIRVDDEEERHEITEDGVDQDVTSAEPVLG